MSKRLLLFSQIEHFKQLHQTNQTPVRQSKLSRWLETAHQTLFKIDHGIRVVFARLELVLLDSLVNRLHISFIYIIAVIDAFGHFQELLYFHFLYRLHVRVVYARVE